MDIDYGGISLTIKTLLTKFFGQPDLERWQDLQNYELSWNERTKIIADLIPQGSKIIEFGAGRRQLESYLEPSCIYFPSDLVSRGSDTIVCDLNTRPLPVLADLSVNVAVFAGVLEYISDLQSLVDWLSQSFSICIVSYECAQSQPKTFQRGLESWSRIRTGWVNTYNEQELKSIFGAGNFFCCDKRLWTTKDGDEYIFVFQNNTKITRDE